MQMKIGAAGTNQVREDYTFDAQTGLLTNQKATKNGSLFIDLSYDYARNSSVGTLNGKTGHLTKITDNLNTQKSREYEFDVLGRLMVAKGGPTGTLWTQTYTFDRYGNRTNVAKTGTAAGGGTMPLDGIPSLAYDNNTNRITTAGYQYDVNGNMIRSLAEDGVTWVKYEYDAANRLNIIKKDDANQTQLERFQYDSTNARVQSHDPALDRYKSYLNAGGTTVAEFTEFVVGVPKWTKSYTYLGDSQLATITPDGGYTTEITEFNHPDRLGTKVITNQATGTASEQAHLPFGRPLDAESTMTGNNKRFTSYDRSNKTNLDYAVNRTYDSKLGRFTQVDSIGMQAASLAAPQTLNMYAYCINDPVNYVDPSGLFLGSFFRWLGRVLLGLSRSRVARRIAIRFVVSFAVSGGNFGVAIRSVLPDILQATGIFPDPRSTVPWYPGSRLPISLGTSSLSRYIIVNFEEIIDDENAIITIFTSCPKNLGIETDLCPSPWFTKGRWGKINDWLGGFADGLLFDLPGMIDDWRGINRGTDRNSRAYNSGWWTGLAGSLVVDGAGAARGAGYSLRIGRYTHGGGGINVLKNGARKFAIDYHKFKTRGQWVKKIHFHWGKTASQLKKHRNIFGKPYPK